MSTEKLSKKQKEEWDKWLVLSKRISLSNKPPERETEKQKQERIKYLLKPENFPEFVDFYYNDGENNLAEFGWFHKEAIHDITVLNERNNIWEWPRECAKSVLGDLFIASWLLFTGWLDGLILASGTAPKANKLIGDLEAHLRNNKRIINDFGDFGITGSWMSGFFQTQDGVGFWAFGIGQNPAGVRNGFKRPNLGIVDDADSKKMAKNQTIILEMVDWIKGEFCGCLQTKKRIFIYSNNRVHKHGITAHMVGDLNEGDPKIEGYKHIKVYWTEDPKTHLRLMPDEGGVSCWKENYTIQNARDKIKDMGPRNSMRQLYHIHVEDGNVFTDDNMPWVKPLKLHEYDALVTYCDPAFGESGKGCFRGIVLIGLKAKDYHILWVWLKAVGNFANAHYDIAQTVEENRPSFIQGGAVFRQKVNCTHWVESNELQKIHLKRVYGDENEKREHAWMPKFDMDKKADKIGRIESLETVADNGHLLFNEELKTNTDMQTLRDQFKGFPDGFIDGPDAVEGGIGKLKVKSRTSSKSMRSGRYAKPKNRTK